MKKLLPLFAGLGVVLAGSLVQGLWTGRWEASAELEAAVARLERLPETAGPWKAKPLTLDPEALGMARASGSWGRTFVHSRTGAAVTVILLCGRSGPMSVHRPEQCYRGAGYEILGRAVKTPVPALAGPALGEFWTADFVKDEAAEPEHLRIFWTWYNGDRWQAVDSPRLVFANLPVLYKLYVIRSQEFSSDLDGQQEEPCFDLLKYLLPELGQTLTPPS